MNRMWAIVERELRKFFRSPTLMLVSMVFPLVQLIVLGNAFGGKIKDAKLGVVDLDGGTQSVKIHEALAAVQSTRQREDEGLPQHVVQTLADRQSQGPLRQLVVDEVQVRVRMLLHVALDRLTELRPGEHPHLVVLRRAVWERDEWIARSLTDAFVRANRMFAAAQRNFPYVSPWLDIELEETEALMGTDFHPYGFAENRAAIDAFCRQAFDLGIVGRLISPDEYFAEYLRSAGD